MIGEEMNLPRDGSTLSAAGEARSESIRAAVLASAAVRRRRRTLVRGGAAVGAVAMAAAAVLWVARAGHSKPGLPHQDIASIPGPALPVQPAHTAGATEPRTASAAGSTEPTVVRREFGTEPGIVDRLAVTSELILVREIGDSELIALVGATGNRYGLARIGDRVRMICLDCGGRTSGGAGTN